MDDQVLRRFADELGQIHSKLRKLTLNFSIQVSQSNFFLF